MYSRNRPSILLYVYKNYLRSFFNRRVEFLGSVLGSVHLQFLVGRYQYGAKRAVRFRFLFRLTAFESLVYISVRVCKLIDAVWKLKLQGRATVVYLLRTDFYGTCCGCYKARLNKRTQKHENNATNSVHEKSLLKVAHKYF